MSVQGLGRRRDVVEAHSPAGEFLKAIGGEAADLPDGGTIAEASAGGEGVVNVSVDGVVGMDDAGDAALCPSGVGFIESVFGEDDDFAGESGVLGIGGGDGGAEAGDAGTDDEGVGEDLREQA